MDNRGWWWLQRAGEEGHREWPQGVAYLRVMYNAVSSTGCAAPLGCMCVQHWPCEVLKVYVPGSRRTRRMAVSSTAARSSAAVPTMSEPGMSGGRGGGGGSKGSGGNEGGAGGEGDGREGGGGEGGEAGGEGGALQYTPRTMLGSAHGHERHSEA